MDAVFYVVTATVVVVVCPGRLRHSVAISFYLCNDDAFSLNAIKFRGVKHMSGFYTCCYVDYRFFFYCSSRLEGYNLASRNL